MNNKNMGRHYDMNIKQISKNLEKTFSKKIKLLHQF